MPECPNKPPNLRSVPYAFGRGGCGRRRRDERGRGQTVAGRGETMYKWLHETIRVRGQAASSRANSGPTPHRESDSPF